VRMMVTYLMLGCTQVINPRFDAELWLRTVQQQQVTVAVLVPTMINSIINHPSLHTFDLTSLRTIFYGGGPTPPAVLRKALQTLLCGFTQSYGMTETLEATFLLPEDHILDGTADQTRRLASAGREAVGADVRIVDDGGTDLGTDHVGEILIRSRSVIRGYWNAPEATAEAIKHGWFYTGDLGYLDEDRYLFVVDRKKDVVMSGGVNIYTKEIETVIYTHPAVMEAAVLGLPDDHWGEVVTACVVLRPGAALTAEELVHHCQERLASYKKPRRVVFLSELPKSPSGKILKREIKQLLIAG
jgi:long-chain acyl-CoA synthetase